LDIQACYASKLSVSPGALGARLGVLGENKTVLHFLYASP
jgi:hypothetical protein